MARKASAASAEPNRSSVARPSLISGTRSVSFMFSLSCNFVENSLASLLLNDWNLLKKNPRGLSSPVLVGFVMLLTFLVVNPRNTRPCRRPYQYLSHPVLFQVAYSSSWVPPPPHRILLPPRFPLPRCRGPHRVERFPRYSASASCFSLTASRPL
jgi:hypothetical protein